MNYNHEESEAEHREYRASSMQRRHKILTQYQSNYSKIMYIVDEEWQISIRKEQKRFGIAETWSYCSAKLNALVGVSNRK